MGACRANRSRGTESRALAGTAPDDVARVLKRRAPFGFRLQRHFGDQRGVRLLARHGSLGGQKSSMPSLQFHQRDPVLHPAGPSMRALQHLGGLFGPQSGNRMECATNEDITPCLGWHLVAFSVVRPKRRTGYFAGSIDTGCDLFTMNRRTQHAFESRLELFSASNLCPTSRRRQSVMQTSKRFPLMSVWILTRCTCPNEPE